MALKTYAVHFSGVGGACVGIHQAGLSCNLAIEHDALRVEYRKKNLGHQGLAIDIRNYSLDDDHKADLLWTSPPCTMISSLSREYVDMDDPINSLYLESVKYCKIFKPKFFVLENVMGILTHKADGQGGSTLATWRRDFESLGYHTEFNVLNSKYFGVPQDRERVFLIGSLEGKKGLVPFEHKNVRSTFKDVMQPGAVDECWSLETYKTVLKTIARNSAKIRSPYRFTLIGPDDIFPTITCSFDGGATRKKTAIIDSVGGVTYLRQPTVREGARAQGFPDDWVFPESKTKAWNMIGDAVTSNVARAIVEHLSLIDEGKKSPHKLHLSAKRIPEYVGRANQHDRLCLLDPIKFDVSNGEDESMPDVSLFEKF